MKKQILRLLPFLFALLLMSGCAAAADEPTVPETTEIFMETVPAVTAAAEETLPETERFWLTFVGDCTLGTHPGNYNADVGFVKLVGEDYRYPFANVISLFEEDECSFANLEGPLCDDGTSVVKKHTFRGPREFVRILTENSVEAVSLANNHTMDYGTRGYLETKETLESAAIPYVERDVSRVFTTKNGLTVGLYGAVYDRLDREEILSGIRELDAQGLDLVIFAPHWGYEGSFVPNRDQIALGRAAIEAGADIVWGSHPHVLQPVEVWEKGIIFYSLGNFVFGGNGKPRDFDTAVIRQEILRHPDGTVTLGETVLLPACVSSESRWNNFQPVLCEAGTDSYDRILAKLSGTWKEACIKIG